MMNSDYKDFINCLQTATSEIKEEYFLLPIDGSRYPIYRERVYCYELYHQLRNEWGESRKFTINGEVDKSGHPKMNGPYISSMKPDLLVHTPGLMEGNFIVIEVKSISAKKDAIERDLKKLSAYVTKGRYRHAIYLIYGGDEGKMKLFMQKVLLSTNDPEILLPRIELFWHSRSGNKAKRIKLFYEISKE